MKNEGAREKGEKGKRKLKGRVKKGEEGGKSQCLFEVPYITGLAPKKPTPKN